MSTLLNAILDISKLEAGSVKPRPAPFPIARVLDRLRSAFSEEAARRGLELRIRRCSGTVETDEVLLYRILVNLAHNALRYTERGGVLVGCRRRADGLCIEVWDTGIGIPADKFEEIFREFHQLGNPQRDREQGVGLGLAIVERTARVLGSPIRVRSRLGRGSVFSIIVPYGESRAMPVVEAGVPEALDGCAILVIEDDREIRAAIALLLEGWKCVVAVASTGSEVDAALSRLGMPPDAIIADFRLPGAENGLQLIARVRERHPSASAILVTGDVAPDTLREAQAAGHSLLHKPLRPARLRSLLGAALRNRPEEAVERAREVGGAIP
jgi:CheY-like chemotaxis protein/anti-sigma regulatory factor (Ser/Thr protein kinase)